MDIIRNKKRRLTNREEGKQVNRKKKQIKNSKRKSGNLKLSLDGIGKKIPSSSIRRDKQLRLLHEARVSFSMPDDSLEKKVVSKGYLKAIEKSKHSTSTNSLDGFYNSRKISSSNYHLEEVGFNSINQSGFLNRKCSTESNELEFLEEKSDLIFTARLWKFSLVGAMVLGMVVMGFIHQNLGDNVLAKIENSEKANEEEVEDNLYFSQEENFYSRGEITTDQKKELEKKMREMVAGQPIENMIPYILEQDYHVAAYLIAIAKKESQWGSRVPVLNGKDCYNYWGYRENRDLMGSAGHTCFNSRKDAVETVGARLDNLIYKNNKQTAADLIVWKCGSTCEGHSQEGVDSWIGTVEMYYKKLVK